MKILMIEDDEAIRTGLKYYLEQENFEVIETDNGKDKRVPQKSRRQKGLN